MISRLFIRNFQKHRKLVLKLHPHVTTITGPTDAGKSAIVRALRWLVLNSPTGTSFIRKGSRSGTKLVLTVDGVRISRLRTKSKNEYKVGDKVLKSFGSGVPQKVSRTLNVTEDNFQSQHDSPYWLSMTPGQLSKAINNVVDLSLIDHAAAFLSREVRDAGSAVRISEERLEQARSDREEAAYAEQMDADLHRVELLSAAADNLCTDVQHLREAVSLARRHVATVARVSDHVHRSERGTGRLERRSDGARSAAISADTLGALASAARREQMNITAAKRRLGKIEQQLSQYERCPVCDQITKS
jgi:exonuclease SbcC